MGFAFVSYALRRMVAIGFFTPPPVAAIAEWPRQMAISASVGCAALSVFLPLLEGWHAWEAAASVMWMAQLLGIITTHSMYTGGVVASIEGEANPRVARLGAYLFTAAAAAAVGSSLTYAAIPLGSVVWPYHTFLPAPYVMLVVLAFFAFANALPLAAAMETWY